MSPKTIYKYHYHYNAIQHSYEVITSSCYCGAQCAPYLRLLLLISSQFKLSIVSTDKWLAKSQFNRELDSRHIDTCPILNHETLKRRAFPMIHLSLVFTWIQKAKHGDWKQFRVWKKTIFDLNKKVLNYLQIAMFSGGQKIYKREEWKNKTNKNTFVSRRTLKHELNKQQIKSFLFAGGQEHPEQVQRGGGEEIAHSGGAGIRLCIWNHFQLRRICICMYLHVFACTSRCIWNHFELSRTCICS